ncbi:MAG TPA: hypothetical protein VKC59_00410 [Candidatus Limnocylindrales bacterium]|nr:hypothetical protein [Candidatus Limnocylindrales bacterium]
MSPQVRLVCYPRTDGVFSAAAALHLRIELPAHYSAEEVVGEIQLRLRDRYPLASIQVETALPSGGASTWHVYRDGFVS